MTQETNLLDIDAACLIEETDVQTTPVVEVIKVESKVEPKKRGRKKRILQSTGGGENNDSATSAVDDKKKKMQTKNKFTFRAVSHLLIWHPPTQPSDFAQRVTQSTS